VKEKRKKESLV